MAPFAPPGYAYAYDLALQNFAIIISFMSLPWCTVVDIPCVLT